MSNGAPYRIRFDGGPCHGEFGWFESPCFLIQLPGPVDHVDAMGVRFMDCYEYAGRFEDERRGGGLVYCFTGTWPKR